MIASMPPPMNEMITIRTIRPGSDIQASTIRWISRSNVPPR